MDEKMIAANLGFWAASTESKFIHYVRERVETGKADGYSTRAACGTETTGAPDFRFDPDAYCNSCREHLNTDIDAVKRYLEG